MQVKFAAARGMVAKPGEVLEAIENGLLDIGDVHVPFEPSKMLAYNFGYFVPFGTEDAVKAGLAARKVFDAYPQLRTNLERRFNRSTSPPARSSATTW